MEYSQTLDIGGSRLNGATVAYEELSALLAKIAFSSVFLGAMGGLSRGLFNNKGFVYCLKAVILGAILAMVSSPVITERLSSDLVPFALFLVGYCGLQGVDFFIGLGRTFVENHFEEFGTKVLAMLKINGKEH